MCATLAESGTAETPAAPIKGFTFSLLNTFISLANVTPAAVAKLNATHPIAKIFIESGFKKTAALVDAPTPKPMKMVQMSSSADDAVLASLVVTPDSRKRLPKNSGPNRGNPPGATKMVTINAPTGKATFSNLLTFRPGAMRMRRSFFVVSNFIIGGCITGTIAI